MKVVVIGGTGHIGSFLVPQLVADGHTVTVIARGQRAVPARPGFDKVTIVRETYSRKYPAWPRLLASLNAEVVVDILGAHLPGVYEATKRTCRHLVATGSVWMLGSPRRVPVPPEEQSPCPFEWYGMRWRELNDTRARARTDGVAFTAVLPPNICGPGKVPIVGKGGRVVELHKAHARGDAVQLPEHCNTLISPCDASDVARVHALAVSQRDAAADEVFNAGAPDFLPAPRFIEALAAAHGSTIPIEWVSAEKFYGEILPDEGASYHFREHMAPDIQKTRAKLGYAPEFTCEQTLARAVGWMHDTGLL
ncbi:MAG TPA: NAD(P)-dependent oxidoreductase [Planctomycetota bacterium]|nr:NAD(P)-dependent oxidoreductase [Planctomycetota bacterium]